MSSSESYRLLWSDPWRWMKMKSVISRRDVVASELFIRVLGAVW